MASREHGFLVLVVVFGLSAVAGAAAGYNYGRYEREKIEKESLKKAFQKENELLRKEAEDANLAVCRCVQFNEAMRGNWNHDCKGDEDPGADGIRRVFDGKGWIPK